MFFSALIASADGTYTMWRQTRFLNLWPHVTSSELIGTGTFFGEPVISIERVTFCLGPVTQKLVNRYIFWGKINNNELVLVIFIATTNNQRSNRYFPRSNGKKLCLWIISKVNGIFPKDKLVSFLPTREIKLNRLVFRSSEIEKCVKEPLQSIVEKKNRY
jgi:hypothetical protein